jgi:beta-lactamase regulating signal transducer with metallopeptidase domain/HEAT repeat protein
MNHFTDTVVEPALWFLADWSLRWAALIGLLAVGLWVLRRRRPATRSLLGWVVLLAGLLLPALPRWGPTVATVTPREEPPVAAETNSALDGPAPKHRAAPPFPRAAHQNDEPSQAVHPPAEPSETPPSIPEPPAEPLGLKRTLLLLLATYWVVGVLVLLVRWGCGWFYLARLRRRATPVEGEPARLLDVCRRELGLRGRPCLAHHPAVGSPVTVGLWRPLVLVPAGWADRPPLTQRACLLHELAHLARGDHWRAPLLRLVWVAFFFHPAVRWLLTRLECERELLCDEAAVARGIDPHAFVRMLLEFSRRPGRLLPGIGIGTGTTRTVTIRIHHLLEANVNHLKSPLPAWRAYLLGAAVLAGALGLGSLRPRAAEAEPTDEKTTQAAKVKDEEPLPAKRPDPPSVKRESLRYGGKSFDQWRTELATELKPQVRVEGMKALSAFGANGYGQEATEAILDIMRGYEPQRLLEDWVFNLEQFRSQDEKARAAIPDDARVVIAGLEAVVKIGSDAAPALAAGLRGGNRNARRFAAVALRQLGKDAKAAVPGLLNVLKGGDTYLQMHALTTIAAVDPGAKGLVPFLADSLKKDRPEGLRSLCLRVLSDLGHNPKADRKALLRDAVPALLLVLKEEGFGYGAITALSEIQPEAKAVVPALAVALKNPDERIQSAAIEMLQRYGPEAKDATPALIELLKTKKSRIQPYVLIDTLGGIGPAAKEAIPALNAILRDSAFEEGTRAAAARALKKIEAK